MIAYGVYAFSGADGIIILKSACILFAFVVLFRCGYRNDRSTVTTLFFYLAVLCSQERFFARPEIFSLPLFALFLAILLKEESGRSRCLYLLPLLQVLWVNVQGLFVLGVVLVFFHFVSRALRGEFKRPALLLLLCAAACFINPYTYRGVLFPLVLFQRVGHFSNVFTSTIAEFISPIPTLHPARLAAAVLSFRSYTLSSFILLAFLALFTFFLNFRRTNLFLVLCCAAFFYLAASAKRNLPLFAFAAAAASIYNVNSFLDGSSRGRRLSLALSKSASGASVSLLVSALALVTIFLVVTDGFSIHEKSTRSFGFGVSSPTYPVGAVDFVQAHDIRGNVFNTLAAGGYFAWRCYPGRREFIDGRLEAISDEFYGSYISLLRDPSRWPGYVEKYGITYAVLDHWVNPEDALFSRIYRDDSWALAYIDAASAVFLLRNQENAPVIEKHDIDLAALGSVAAPASTEPTSLSRLTDRWIRKKRFPFLEFTLGNLYFAVGLYGRAADYYAMGLETAPDEAALHNNIGICFLNDGKPEAAIASFGRALALDPSHRQAVKNMATAYQTAGDTWNALRYWEMAYRMNQEDPAVRRSLDETRRRLVGLRDGRKSGPWSLLQEGRRLEAGGDLEGAIGKYGEAAALRPDMPQPQYQLGLAYGLLGDLESADRHFREAVRLGPDDGRARHNLAALCQRRGMTREAIDHYLSSLAVDPDSIPTNFNLAVLYYETGKKKKAVKYLETVLDLDPGFEEAEELLEKLR